MKSSHKQKGFTLVETLIYVTIFAMMVVAFSSFTSGMNVARAKNQTVLEVNDQGAAAFRTMTQAIRNARAINTPSISSVSTTLSIATTASSTNPTTFSASGGVLYITEGAGAATALTNNKVKVSNLMFTNLSRAATPGTVRMSFTVNAMATSSRPQDNHSADFYGSASIR